MTASPANRTPDKAMMTPMPEPSRGIGWKYAWLVLAVVLFCVPLFVGLGGTDLENDEAIYSYATDSILETGDWLNPRSSPDANIVFVEKPPLKFWLVAAAIRTGLVPHDEFGLRFWDALFGVAAFLYVFAIGQRLAGPLCGFVAVFVLFAYQPLLFEHGLRSNDMDAAVFLAYCGGVFHYLRWAESSEPRVGRRHAVAVGLYFVLGFMTKFVAVLFLPLILGVASLALAPIGQKLRRDWHLWMGVAALVIALIVPWFAYQMTQPGTGIWNVMFREHVFTRFTASLDPSHVHGWNYYFVGIYRQLNPRSWTFWLAVAGGVLLLARILRERPADAIVAIAWFALPLTLMSFGTSKLGHYAFPFLPPLALAVACVPVWVMRVGRQPGSREAGAPESGAAGARLLQVLRVTCVVLSAAAAVLAVGTAVHGSVKLTLGGVTIVRNQSVLRAAVGAALLGAFGARGLGVARPVIVAALLFFGPIPGYLEALPRVMVESHPLRSARDCVLQVRQNERAAGRLAPGLLASLPDPYFGHPLFYYFHRAGWERHDQLSDEEVDRALNVAGASRPVLLPRDRYARFRERQGAPVKPGLLTSRSDWAGTRPGIENGTTPTMRVLQFDDVLLLLPGPYAACGTPPGPTFSPTGAYAPDGRGGTGASNGQGTTPRPGPAGGSEIR